MKIKPLADRLIVRPVEVLEMQEAKRGSIIIPDTAQEKPQLGEVVEVGPGKTGEDGKRVALVVKKGDKIIYGKYSGTSFTFNGSEYLILKEDDVLAIVE